MGSAIEPRAIEVPARAEALIYELLGMIGDNPRREGLADTPTRVRRSLAELTQGYTLDPADVLEGAIFDEEYDEMVVVKDIEFYSLCEHHLLPFFGKAHIAYIPDGQIIGLARLPKLVEVFSRRLQVQERLTTEIADALWHALGPKGVAVVIEGAHLCMMMRGLARQGSTTVTSCMRGRFKTDQRTRLEFLNLIGRANG